MFRGLNFTKHCNAQKIPKFPTPKITKHCNAQKILKIPNFFGNLVLAWTYMPEFWNFWNFLSITVFREFWGWEFWNFLSIAVFRGLNFTKHCNAQKIPKFSGTWSWPGHRCQNFGIFGIF